MKPPDATEHLRCGLLTDLEDDCYGSLHDLPVWVIMWSLMCYKLGSEFEGG